MALSSLPLCAVFSFFLNILSAPLRSLLEPKLISIATLSREKERDRERERTRVLSFSRNEFVSQPAEELPESWQPPSDNVISPDQRAIQSLYGEVERNAKKTV